MTASEVSQGLQALGENGWVVQLRMVVQEQSPEKSWVGKAIKGDQIVNANGNTLREVGAELILKIAP